MKITDLCIERPVFAWMLMAATLVFGWVALQRIGISQYPDVDFPTISVRIGWEGAAPEVIENDLIEIAEEALVQVEGVRTISSTARQGSGSITLELDLHRDVDLAMQDVQAKLAQIQRRFPTDVDPPIVSKTNPEDQPILWLALTGPFSQQVLSDVARYRVAEKLQTVPGVGEIMMGGYLERNIRIWLDAKALDARGLTVADIMAALRREHVELPAGRLEAGGREINVRVLGEAFDLGELRRLVIANVAGSPVYLEDVALVEDGFEDVRRRARVNGVPAQGIGIKKQRGSNAVAVAQGVRAVVAEMQKTLPEGMSLAINFDSTRFVEESVAEIRFELLLAIFLTAFVCWAFLGSLSSTLNVVLAIPMSLLGTIAVVYFLGYTLNTFTLLGLALAVGIVVDDAIMVLENIFRHAESGKPMRVAAKEGTHEITFAALAATFAVVAIFIPVVFMKGVVGRFFLQFGVALSVAVLLSYVEAVTLAPARCAQFVRTSEQRRGLGLIIERAFERLARAYRTALGFALCHHLMVLATAGGLFVVSLLLIGWLPKEFVPSQDQSRLMVRLQTAVGSTLDETDTLFRQAEAWVNGRPEVLRAFAVVGGFGGADVNTGVMFVTLVPPAERAVTQNEFAGMLRKELNAIPGLKAIVQDLSQQGFTAQRGFPVEFSVRGGDWETLIELSQRCMRELMASGLVVDLDSDYQVGMPEVRVIPDRDRAADLGVPIEDVALVINAMIGGVRVGKYNAAGRRIDVRMRLLAEQRTSPNDLANLRVRTRHGELIPLAALVRLEERPALHAITRKDRERAITVVANVAPGHSQEEAIRKVESLAGDLPVGYRVVLGGASVAFRESMNSLMFALVLGVVFAYMVLASQFNSFLHPITVLTILPLSITGVVGGLWITGKSLNIFSMIGVLLLLGIVKKNSIILVDYANVARNQGKDAAAAMLHAAPVRLRPILMTSVATLMAALPPALGLGPGSEIRAPMATAVIGGILVSTVLSLFVVPAFYVTADQGKTVVGHWLAARRRGVV